MNGGESKSNKRRKYPTSNTLNLDKPNVGGNEYEPWKHVMNFLEQDEIEQMRLEGKTFANSAVGRSLKYVEVIAPQYTPMGEQPRPRGKLPPHVKPDLNSALVAFQRFKAANPGRRFEIRLQRSTVVLGRVGFKTGFNLDFGNGGILPGVIGGGTFYGLELPRDQDWNDLKIISAEFEVLYGVNDWPGGLNYSVVLNDTRYLKGSCFYRCGGMVAIKFPENLKRIGLRAFEGCVNLEYFNNPIKPEFKGIMTFPQSLETIDSIAFANCMKIRSIVFPRNLSNLGRQAFRNTNVMDLDFTSCRKLKLIGGYAFFECKQLRNFKLPPNLETIEPRAFCGCERITSLVIPPTVSEIFSRAFGGCTSLRYLHILNSCTGLDIRRYAFEHCAFEKVLFPDRVKSIGAGAFRNCPNLVQVSLNTIWVTEIKEDSFDPNVEIIRRDFLADQPRAACTIMLAPTLRF